MKEFTDPILLESMPLGEKLLNSGITMLLGMGITFLVLITLMFSIKLMSSILGPKKEKVQAPEPKPTPQPVAPVVSAELLKEVDQQDTNEELIAVITAAIMASRKAAGESAPFSIQRVRKQGEQVPSWAAAGMHDAMNN